MLVPRKKKLVITRRSLLTAAAAVAAAGGARSWAFPPLRGFSSAGSPPADAMSALLATMPANSWANPVAVNSFLPTTYHNDTTAADYNAGVDTDGGGNLVSIGMTGPFEGMAFDTFKNRMILGYGGGHYAGAPSFLGQALALDLASLTWSRMNTPQDENQGWFAGVGYVTNNGNSVGATLTVLSLNAGSGPIRIGMQVICGDPGNSYNATDSGIMVQVSGTPGGAGVYTLQNQQPNFPTTGSAASPVPVYSSGFSLEPASLSLVPPAQGAAGYTVNNPNCPSSVGHVPPSTHTYSSLRYVPGFPTVHGSLWLDFQLPWHFWDLSFEVPGARNGTTQPGLNWIPPNTRAAPGVTPACSDNGWRVTPFPTAGWTYAGNAFGCVVGTSAAPAIYQFGGGSGQACMSFRPNPGDWTTGTWGNDGYYMGNGNVAGVGQRRGSLNEIWQFNTLTNNPDSGFLGVRQFLTDGSGTHHDFAPFSATGDVFMKWAITPPVIYHPPSGKFILMCTTYQNGPWPPGYTPGFPNLGLRNDVNSPIPWTRGSLSPGNIFDVYDPATNTVTQKITNGPFGGPRDARTNMPQDLNWNPQCGCSGPGSGLGDHMVWDAVHGCIVYVSDYTDPNPVYVYKPDATFPS